MLATTNMTFFPRFGQFRLAISTVASGFFSSSGNTNTPCVPRCSCRPQRHIPPQRSQKRPEGCQTPSFLGVAATEGAGRSWRRFTRLADVSPAGVRLGSRFCRSGRFTKSSPCSPWGTFLLFRKIVFDRLVFDACFSRMARCFSLRRSLAFL